MPQDSTSSMRPENGRAEASATILTFLTAWQMVFKKGQVKPGQTVLIHAAGSGVSSLAIKLCKMVGARVIATTGSPEKRERALAIGADEVIVSSAQDFVAEVKRLTGKLGADVILDHVGGEIFEKSIAAAAWGGKIDVTHAAGRTRIVVRTDVYAAFINDQESLAGYQSGQTYLVGVRHAF